MDEITISIQVVLLKFLIFCRLLNFSGETVIKFAVGECHVTFSDSKLLNKIIRLSLIWTLQNGFCTLFLCFGDHCSTLVVAPIRREYLFSIKNIIIFFMSYGQSTKS